MMDCEVFLPGAFDADRMVGIPVTLEGRVVGEVTAAEADGMGLKVKLNFEQGELLYGYIAGRDSGISRGARTPCADPGCSGGPPRSDPPG